ncbi:uncharacterized protein BX664DRAFT_283783 [Halteromyces radiatus]|uniref:uncharacterized protein n=1 Tax=Halteromyces radiatus TaxID=101107 RepID=UPI0022207A5E|nr:uncharacterized protein BX664DRAFT_283783 [Halteromyces radiatus]KAI8084900.1 hypothetical protein BX664DRAFT_283783 [Halteromyces radiatus]
MTDQDPYGAINFGEFRKYMQNKQSKLKEQEAILGNQAEGNIIPILKGLSIYVNGYTDPPQSELRRIIVQYGGDYQHYLKKSKVTHIIATTLTNSKMHEFRAYKVVTPSWIMDSIKAGQLLPWTKYRVIHNERAQKEIKFNRSISTESSSTTLTSIRQNIEELTSGNDNQLSNTKESICHSFSTPTNVNRPSPLTIAPLRPSSSASSRISPQPSSPSSKLENIQPSGKDLNAALLSNPWNRNNSTANPDFVKRYYQSSRLHHLSSWKAELKDIVRKAKEQRSSSSHSLKQKQQSHRRLVMHVDFDCFFASVGIKSRPELSCLPVAVSHGKGLQKNSSSDIASCNYIARSFGIRNGMRVGQAQELCPDLHIIPYEFEEYRKVSEIFYNILFEYADEIQAVSVDEALLEVGSHITQAETGQEESLAKKIRDDIRERTGCEASIGIGPNILIARLATKKAKPCNQYYCKTQDIQSFLTDQNVGDLPGVGYSMESKLQEMGVTTVGQLGKMALSTLKSKFGPKTGQTLYSFAKGIDDRPLVTDQPRQSLSAEVNWGVRFENDDQADKFLESLATEVSERLKAIDKKGKNITLKVLVRSIYAGEAEKHLGCGECDSYSKSITLDSFTNDPDLIASHVKRILKTFSFLVSDIRGLGIQIQKLNDDDDGSDSEDERQSKLPFGTMTSSTTDKVQETETCKDIQRKNKMTVDYNVYMELPQNIQQELKDGYELELVHESTKNQQQPMNSSKSITMENNNNNNNNMTTASTQSLTVLPSWSQLDPAALLALPNTMQKQVLEAYTTISSSTETREHGKQQETSTSVSKFSLKTSTSSSTTNNGNSSRITKSPQNRRTKSKTIEKKPVVTLTQLFPPSPKRSSSCQDNDSQSGFDVGMLTNTNNNDDDDDISTTGSFDHDDQLLGNMHPKDTEIWSQLPRDIQQELLEIYRQKQERKRHHQVSTRSSSPLTSSIALSSSAESNNKVQKEPKLMGKSELEDVRNLLNEWVQEYKTMPDPKDVDTVTNYLKQLVWYKDLERAQLLLMHLNHIIRRQHGIGPDWIPFMDKMQQTISTEVEAIFKAPLGL